MNFFFPSSKTRSGWELSITILPPVNTDNISVPLNKTLTNEPITSTI